MNIGIDIRALGQKKVTGIGNYIVNSLKYIFELDKVNNYYLLSSGLRSKIDPDIKFKQENVSYIHVSIPNKILNLSLKVGFCRSLNKFFPEKIDLLWLPNINFYKFDQTVPTILTIHDLSFLHSREFYSLKRRIWHRFINVDQLASEVDKIIAVSENTKNDFLENNFFFFFVAVDGAVVIFSGKTNFKIIFFNISVCRPNIASNRW